MSRNADPASGVNGVRNEESDLLKALAILGVVWIHGAALIRPSRPSQALYDLARTGVPIFITLWAYFLEKSLRRGGEVWPVIGRRFLAYLIPYLAWSLAFPGMTGGLTRMRPAQLINGGLGGFGWSGQYFLLLLLQLLPLFPWIRRVATPEDDGRGPGDRRCGLRGRRVLAVVAARSSRRSGFGSSLIGCLMFS